MKFRLIFLILFLITSKANAAPIILGFQDKYFGDHISLFSCDKRDNIGNFWKIMDKHTFTSFIINNFSFINRDTKAYKKIIDKLAYCSDSKPGNISGYEVRLSYLFYEDKLVSIKISDAQYEMTSKDMMKEFNAITDAFHIKYGPFPQNKTSSADGEVMIWAEYSDSQGSSIEYGGGGSFYLIDITGKNAKKIGDDYKLEMVNEI